MPLIKMVSNPMSKGFLLDRFKWHAAAMELRNTFVVATWVSVLLEGFEDAWMNVTMHFCLMGT
jgi:hypothetical protein